jgi:hypothetical protein
MNDRTIPPGVNAELLLDIFDLPISFHRCLVPVTGGVTAALMLSQAIWTSEELDPEAGGWFCRSQEQWTEETGLSRWEQETARRALRNGGFVDERRAGLPARLWFRVRPEAVSRALRDTCRSRLPITRSGEDVTGTIILASEGEGDSEDGWAVARQVRAIETLWPLLGRHIAFHRRLVDLTASVKAAVLLSQSIYWTRHGRDIDEAGGWFLKTTGQWRMETGLSAREQDTARLVLRDLAIIEEQRIGFPARLHFRLCLDQLDALLSDRIGRPAGGFSTGPMGRRSRNSWGPRSPITAGWPASAAGFMPGCCCRARFT